MIDLRQIRYFVAVAEELHFGRAARRLNLSQPPLTQQIQSLEHHLGVVLLTRSTRRVELTDAGKAFLERARVILDETDNAVAIARATSSGERGHLEIGHAAPADLQIIPYIVPRFRARYPDVRTTLHSLRGVELIRALKRETIRVAIVRAPVEDAQLASITLSREKLVAVMPDKHPLSRRKGVAFRDLANEPLIFFPRWLAPAYFDTIARLCMKLGGFVFAPSQEIEATQTALALVAAGMGVSLQPTSITVLQREGVTYVPVRDSPHCVELAAVYRKDDDSRLLQNFLEVITEAYGG